MLTTPLRRSRFARGSPLTATVLLLSGACGEPDRWEPPEPRQPCEVAEPAWLAEYGPAEEVYRTGDGGLSEPRRWLTKDRESWERWWTVVSGSETGEPTAPVVDFGDSMLISATPGWANASGPIPRFEGYRIGGDTLFVALRFDVNDGLDMPMLEERPLVVARVPKHDGPVVLYERTVRHPCR